MSGLWDDNNLYEDMEEEDFQEVSEDIDVPTWHPHLLPRAPKEDDHGNGFITVVDVTGIHCIPVVQCLCDDNSEDIDLQFLAIGLFPASFKNVRTVFTFEVLDDFRLENLQCKVSAYHYYHKLRRITCPFFPTSVPSRYTELRRVSRMWRNLKLRQEHGVAHHRHQPGMGEMTYFCAACPQPGVNLRDTWKEDSNR